MKKSIILLILLIVVILTSCNDKDSEPYVFEEKNETGLVIPVYGDGNTLLTFEVEVPDWTPKEDNIHVYIDNFYYGSDGWIRMVKKYNNTWTIKYKARLGQELKYKYNRN